MSLKMRLLFLVPFMCTMDIATGRPSSLVALSTEATPPDSSVSSSSTETAAKESPIISEFKVRSDIRFRYARTIVESYVKNPSSTSAQEVSFTMVIPDSAFISNFSMLLGEKEYVAEVKEKAAAKEAYDEAVSGGQAAGLVSQDARDASRITVSANVEPQGKVRFRLTYEELLRRRLEKYEHVIHVSLGQVVEDFRVDVFINESLPLTSVVVPKFKTDPDEITREDEVNPDAKIVRNATELSKAQVTFKPAAETQKDDGISGQFIVRYDVDRRDEGNEIQTIDGYFVHFFAPANLPVLPKHVVFVLDVSGSMTGEKLVQTKDAMVSIIDDVTLQDYFSIVTFSDGVYKWAPTSDEVIKPGQTHVFQGTRENKNKALKHVLGLETIGGTNINDALVESIQLAKTVKRSESLPGNVKPIIIFMTDGQPSGGVTDGALIRANVREANKDLEVPIYSLAFGADADFNLMKELSSENRAFARRIYEGSDAAIQLEDFYQEIASPLLSDVKFDYVGEGLENETITTTSFSSFSRGNEIVVAGKVGDAKKYQSISVDISGEGAGGEYRKRLQLCVPPIEYHIDESVNKREVALPAILPHCVPQQPPPPQKENRSDEQNFVERLWAFLTIKDLLEEKPSKKDATKAELTPDKTNDKTETAKERRRKAALKLALQYNFVTPITSLVVVKPNETSTSVVDLEPVDLSSPSNRRKTSLSSSPAAFSSVGFGHIASAPSSGYGSGGGGGQTFRKQRPSGSGSSGGGGGAILHDASDDDEEEEQESLYDPANLAPSNFPTTTTLPTLHTTYLPLTTTAFFNNRPAASSSSTTSPPSLPQKTSCSGSVTLFSQTYLRGANVTLTEDEADLSKLGFGKDQLTSLEVKGDCCWQIWEGVGHQGKEVKFGEEGKYKSASDMKEVFRNAASVKKLLKCN